VSIHHKRYAMLLRALRTTRLSALLRSQNPSATNFSSMTTPTTSETRPPLPPFSYKDAVKKVRMAENAWNTRDPHKVP